MKLTKATPADLPAVCAFYRAVCEAMERGGLDMWHWGEYPSEAIVTADVRKGDLYLYREEERILGCVAINREQDEDYASLPWREEGEAGLFHRLAVAPDMQGRHLAGEMLTQVEEILRAQGCAVLRGDVYGGNAKALRLYERMGLRKVGAFRQDWGWEYPFYGLEKRL